MFRIVLIVTPKQIKKLTLVVGFLELLSFDVTKLSNKTQFYDVFSYNLLFNNLLLYVDAPLLQTCVVFASHSKE